MTPEERARKLWDSVKDRNTASTAWFAEEMEFPENIIRDIASAIREAIEECAALLETEAGEVTMARISAAASAQQHADMRAEADVLRKSAEKIRALAAQ